MSLPPSSYREDSGLLPLCLPNEVRFGERKDQTIGQFLFVAGTYPAPLFEVRVVAVHLEEFKVRASEQVPSLSRLRTRRRVHGVSESAVLDRVPNRFLRDAAARSAAADCEHFRMRARERRANGRCSACKLHQLVEVAALRRRLAAFPFLHLLSRDAELGAEDPPCHPIAKRLPQSPSSSSASSSSGSANDAPPL